MDISVSKTTGNTGLEICRKPMANKKKPPEITPGWLLVGLVFQRNGISILEESWQKTPLPSPVLILAYSYLCLVIYYFPCIAPKFTLNDAPNMPSFSPYPENS